MASEVIEFTVPLPPAALRSNSRAYWATKKAAKQRYSALVLAAYRSPGTIDRYDRGRALREGLLSWRQAKVTFVWRYCGVAPDRQNLGANLKALTDILCCAPNNGLQKNNTCYLGLVEDDKGIDPHYELERVKRRAEQGVVIRIERTG